MIIADNMIIDVKAAEYVDAYKLRLVFSDGNERIVDFEPFLQTAQNPTVWKYRELDYFKNFTVAYGDLFWNAYELCFPIADLYEGRL